MSFPIKPRAYIGHGIHGMVFSGEFEGQDVAVKLYRHENTAQKEFNILQRLNGITGVPEPIDHIPLEKTLASTPFASLRPSHFGRFRIRDMVVMPDMRPYRNMQKKSESSKLFDVMHRSFEQVLDVGLTIPKDLGVFSADDSPVLIDWAAAREAKNSRWYLSARVERKINAYRAKYQK